MNSQTISKIWFYVFALVSFGVAVYVYKKFGDDSASHKADLKAKLPYIAAAVAITSFIFGVIMQGNLAYAQFLSESWMSHILLSPGTRSEAIEHPTFETPEDIAILSKVAPAAGKPAAGKNASVGVAIKALEWQRDEIRRKGDFHLGLMAYFYQRYYMAIVTSAMCGVLAAALLFLITNVGWDQASRWYKTFFLTLSVNSAFYLAFPAMFQLQQNISDNKALFLKYQSLDYEMRCYMATGKDSEGKIVPPSDMVINFQKLSVPIANIPIGFDSTKLPSWDSPLKTPANNN